MAFCERDIAGEPRLAVWGFARQCAAVAQSKIPFYPYVCRCTGHRKSWIFRYNTHNQFLEALLQTGLVGLLLFFLAICAEMVIMAVRRKNNMLTALVILLLAYTFSDAVLETQYGLVLFLFLPLFLFFGLNDKKLKIS